MGESAVLSAVNLITFTHGGGWRRLCFLEVCVLQRNYMTDLDEIFFKNVPQLTID